MERITSVMNALIVLIFSASFLQNSTERPCQFVKLFFAQDYFPWQGICFLYIVFCEGGGVIIDGGRTEDFCSDSESGRKMKSEDDDDGFLLLLLQHPSRRRRRVPVPFSPLSFLLVDDANFSPIASFSILKNTF